MSLRVALILAAVCAATPLAAAEAPEAAAVAAGLRRAEPPPKTADTAPRRYSVAREYGETPDPAAFARPTVAADDGLVLQPGFFEPLPPTLAAPPADPARDRQGRPIQQSASDDAPQV